MKKYLPLLTIVILVSSGIGASATIESENERFLSESIFISTLNINDQVDYISLDMEGATSEMWSDGKPCIPFVSKVYTFPFGTTINNVDVTFSNILEKRISKPVVPSPKLYIDSMVTNTKYKEPVEIETYSDLEIYPENDFSFKTAAGLKGEEHVIYLSIHLNPIKYKPNENIIYQAQNAEIQIAYDLPKNQILFPDEYDFLILTPTIFKSALQRLVDHKNNLNPPVKTTMVTLNEIPTGVGVDIQEDIKFFIKDAIENWGITYVLLVGAGVEGEEIFPVRQAWIKSDQYEDYFPSDLYFADIYNSSMQFSDWDVDEDGLFAEYPKDMADIDVLPDVYLAKIPCNNENEVNTIIDKVIYYKQHNLMTKKIMQAGGDSFTSDSVNEGEYANTKVMEKLPEYTTTQLWASTELLTKENIANGFKSSVDFVDFCGHGSWASFATHPPKDKETWVPPPTIINPYHGFLYADFDLYFVNNAKKYPVCVYKSCSNSKYSESPTCFGWKTVNKRGGGGIASYAASGISYGATGTSIVDRTTGWMEVKTFERLISDKILGLVWGASLTDYYTTFQSNLNNADWKTLLEWTLMGDPTVVVENGDDPQLKTINNFNIFQQFFDSFPLLHRLLRLIL